jgi:nicotinamidase-related amidase
MTTGPMTLLQMAGAKLELPKLADSTLVLIDYQNEYRSGPLKLVDVEAAIAEGAALLGKAREAGAKIIHIAHRGAAGGAFDRAQARGQIIDELAPKAGEVVIEKPLPNAFAKTNLAEVLAGAGQRPLVIAGFMTHMCVSSTVRAALDLGHFSTVVASACTTRDLPGGDGKAVPGGMIHQVALTELADRFCQIARSSSDFA